MPGRTRTPWLAAAALALCASLAPAASGEAVAARGDLEAARALFEENLDAIRSRDRARYLACYLDAPTLARTGPEGPRLGFAGLAESAGDAWPDVFEGADLRLVPVAPGVVYGTYRYRVRYGDDERRGLSERLFVRTDDGWRIAVTTAFDAPPGTPPPPAALVGATLVDGTGRDPVPDAVVVIRAGRIECAGPRGECPVPEGVRVVDVAGRFVAPGIVDAHVHFSQTGFADGRPDSLDLRETYPYEEVAAALRREPERWFRAYLCSGVTSVFDVGGYPWTLQMAAATAARTDAPRVVATGPLLSTLDFWLNLPAERQFVYLADEESARAGVRYLASRGASAVKVWYIRAPERPFEEMRRAVLAAGDEARRAGLPLVVHATGLAEAKVAVEAGAHLLVHSVWEAPVDDAFLASARAAGTIYCPTLTVASGYGRMYRAAAYGEAPAVDDPNGCLDAAWLERVARTPELGRGAISRDEFDAQSAGWDERSAAMAENLRRVAAAGIPIAMGTDAGNPLTPHGPSVYAEMEAMQAAGLTPAEVLAASTRVAARAAGIEDEAGTVEPGKSADLVVLGADPLRDAANMRRLELVVRGGVIRSVSELARGDGTP